MINQYRRSTTGGMGRYSHHTHGLNTFFAFTFGLFETINIEWESKDLMSFIAIISKCIYHITVCTYPVCVSGACAMCISH